MSFPVASSQMLNTLWYVNNVPSYYADTDTIRTPFQKGRNLTSLYLICLLEYKPYSEVLLYFPPIIIDFCYAAFGSPA